MSPQTTKIVNKVIQYLDNDIVILDDSLTVCTQLSRVFRHAGFTSVVTLQDPRAGYSEICTIKPKMVVLDILMPHVSGLQILDRIVSNPDLNDTIVIILSSYSSEVEQLAIKSGASAVIPKTASNEEIVRIVSTSFRVASKFGAR